MEMDVFAVRVALRKGRSDIDALVPLSEGEEAVKGAGRLLRHTEATPAITTAAERLQELLDELRALSIDVIDTVDKASSELAGTDSDIGQHFDAAVPPPVGG
jgi:hypothetical protein